MIVESSCVNMLSTLLQTLFYYSTFLCYVFCGLSKICAQKNSLIEKI